MEKKTGLYLINIGNPPASRYIYDGKNRKGMVLLYGEKAVTEMLSPAAVTSLAEILGNPEPTTKIIEIPSEYYAFFEFAVESLQIADQVLQEMGNLGKIVTDRQDVAREKLAMLIDIVEGKSEIKVERERGTGWLA